MARTKHTIEETKQAILNRIFNAAGTSEFSLLEDAQAYKILTEAELIEYGDDLDELTPFSDQGH